MPGRFRVGNLNAVPKTPACRSVLGFSDGYVPIFEEANYVLSGQTLDGTGTPVASCRVDLFEDVAEEIFLQVATSDGSGNFSFTLPAIPTRGYYLRAYNTAGTLVGTTATVQAVKVT